MKFEQRDLGETSEVSSGGGGRGVRREVVTLAVLCFITVGVIWLFFEGLALVATRLITPEMENKWMSLLAPELELWEPEDAQDLAARSQVEGILERLRQHPGVLPLDYRIVYLNEEEPNAFALPGGVIGVTKGLVESLDGKELAIAFVIGHELGHFRNRDHLHGFVRELGTGTTLGFLFGSTGTAMVGERLQDFMQLGYSRRQEYAADDFGLMLVRDLYGNTEGTTRFFEVILSQENMPGWAYMFMTHPDTQKRLQRLQSRP